MLLWFLLVGLVTVQAYEESDSYGRFVHDRYGYRVYSYCFDRYRYPEDQCRDRYQDSPNGRYINRYDEDRYRSSAEKDGYRGATAPNKYDNNDRDGVYVGKGYYKEYSRDVELTCEFPQGTNLISNIVWEKEDDYDRRDRYSNLQDTLGRRMEVRRIGDYGSTLIIKDWEQRDKGVYKCVASRSYTYNRYTETVYMDVVFNPSYSGGSSYNGRSDDFSSYFSRDSGYNNDYASDRYDRGYNRDRSYYPASRYMGLLGGSTTLIKKDEEGTIESVTSD